MDLGTHPGQFQMSQQTPYQAAQLPGYVHPGHQPPLQLLTGQVQRSSEWWVSLDLAQGPGFNMRGTGTVFTDKETWIVVWSPVIHAAVMEFT